MASINIKQLEALVQVAAMGSFRGAASVLKTTQPNISARIARLEQQVGQTLMQRDAGSVRLSPVGVALEKKARLVLDALDDFVASAEAPGLFEGTLRLGVTEIVVHAWLSAYLSQIRQQFPNVQIDLTVDLSSNLSENLLNRSIDLALQNGPYPFTLTGDIPLGSYSLIWVASPQLDIPTKISGMQVFTKHPVLTYARQTQPYQQLAQHFSSNDGVQLVPSTSLGACLRMTLDGLGVACLPEVMVAEAIEQQRLSRLPYHWVPDDLNFNARFHADTASYHLRRAAEIACEVASDFRSGTA